MENLEKDRQLSFKESAKLKEAEAAREAAEPTCGPRTAAEVLMRDQGHEFPNPETRNYKRAVRTKLQSQRDTRYSHLQEKWWKYLLGMMMIVGTALWVVGSPSGLIQNWVFHLQRRPGVAPPAPKQPTKGSPAQQANELYHLSREVNLDHYIKPDIPGESSSTVHGVPKPGEEKLPPEEQHGRQVTDYREANATSIKENPQAQDAEEFLSWLQQFPWKTLSDLLWGFTHLRLTYGAAEIMQIITQTLGILWPTVLNYGIHSGPSSFQTVVNDTFEEERSVGLVKAFVDDIATATGELGKVPDLLDTECAKATSMFVGHVWAITHVFIKAIAAGFKFKLDKAFLCQLQTSGNPILL